MSCKNINVTHARQPARLEQPEHAGADEGCVHVAGPHLRDEDSGESNLPQIGRLFRADYDPRQIRLPRSPYVFPVLVERG